MSKVRPIDDFAWRACDAVNSMVECDEPPAEIHAAIERVRQFFESRVAQTKPRDDFSDLLGV